VYKSIYLFTYIRGVAHYAVLEANAKVNGMGKILHPYPSATLRQIWVPFQICHYILPGSRYAKLDLNRFNCWCSAHAWSNGFGCGFLF